MSFYIPNNTLRKSRWHLLCFQVRWDNISFSLPGAKISAKNRGKCHKKEDRSITFYLRYCMQYMCRMSGNPVSDRIWNSLSRRIFGQYSEIPGYLVYGPSIKAGYPAHLISSPPVIRIIKLTSKKDKKFIVTRLLLTIIRYFFQIWLKLVYVQEVVAHFMW